MILLIFGVLLWSGAHLFKWLAPEMRAGMGDRGKGMVALALVVSIVLMVIGFRRAEPIQIWYSPAFLTHMNNLLMLIAVYLFAASGMKTWLASRMRHPMLAGVKTWALAHLMVNGDLASVILFGGMLAWAVIEMIMINRSEPTWTRPKPSFPVGKEIGAVVGTLIVFGSAALVHIWLGYWPFGA